MKFADGVQETTAATSTATVALLGAVAGGPRTFAAAFTVGDTEIPVRVGDALGNFEIGLYTFTSETLLTRTSILSSSNGGAAVPFPGGTKTVACVLPASIVAKFAVTDQIPYSAAVPLSTAGISVMPTQAVTGAIAFSVSGVSVPFAQVYVRLVANGTNAPTFAGMLEWGGSLGYDNRAGIVNQITFFYDGTDTFYSISQAVNAVAVTAAVAVTMTGPTSGANAVVSTNFTLGVSPVGGTISGTVVVTPSDGGAGGTFTPTTRSLTTGSPTGTFTYTPASSGAKTISVTNNGSLSNPANITYTVAAADLTAPTLSAGSGTQTGTTTANATVTTTGDANGTLYVLHTTSATPPTAAAIKASAFSQAITTTGAKTIAYTGLTASTTYYFHFLHRDAAGNDSAILTTASFTTAASATAPATMAAPVATAGDGTVSVAYVAPSDGGSAITSYTATHSTGPTVSGTANPLVLTVANGVAGTVTITATNAIGTSAASPASNSVTPAASVAYPRAVSRIGLTETGSGPYVYTGTAPGTFTDQRAAADKIMQAGVDGSMTIRAEQLTSTNIIFGVQQDATHGPSTSMGGYLWITGGNWIGSGGTAGATVAKMEGDLLRIRRTSGTWYGEVARAADPTNFTLVRTWSMIAAFDSFGFNMVGAAKFTIVDSAGLV